MSDDIQIKITTGENQDSKNHLKEELKNLRDEVHKLSVAIGQDNTDFDGTMKRGISDIEMDWDQLKKDSDNFYNEEEKNLVNDIKEVDEAIKILEEDPGFIENK